MASKKDKFGKKVRSQLRDSMGAGKHKKPDAEEEQASMHDFVDRMRADADAEQQESPPTESPSQRNPSDVNQSKHSNDDNNDVGTTIPAGPNAADRHSLKKETRDTAHPNEPEERDKDHPIIDPGIPPRDEIQSERTDFDRNSETRRRESEAEIDLPAQGRRGRSFLRRTKKAERPREKHMPRTRDSIYNVSSDIRLEDYTDDTPRGRGLNVFARFAGGLILLAILAYLIWMGVGYFFQPEYKLVISNQYIDEGNFAALAETEATTFSSMEPVYIRFQWEEGQMQSDYLKIRIDNMSSGAPIEEAVLGKRVPIRVNYIYFMGMLDAGNYHIEVTDREERVLMQREFMVR
ncbi:MAG: hypothetical protein KDK34_13990 [Leptospiraceae bacterium]|nr:hypothetical protein [Leptospiraceae bacterium]